MYAKKQENMTHLQKKKLLIETVPEKAYILGLPDSDSKSAVLNVLKELKEIKDKELKKTRRMITHQRENINNEREVIEKNQIKKILELKKYNNCIGKFTREVQQQIGACRRISKLKR